MEPQCLAQSVPDPSAAIRASSNATASDRGRWSAAFDQAAGTGRARYRTAGARQRAAALHGQRKEGWGAVGRPRKLSYALRDVGAGRANLHRGCRSVRGRLITATPGVPMPTAGGGSVFIKDHLTCSGDQQLEGTSVASPTDHGKVNPSVTALLAARNGRTDPEVSACISVCCRAQGRKAISTSSTCGTECWASAPGGGPEQPLSVREPRLSAAPTWRTA